MTGRLLNKNIVNLTNLIRNKFNWKYFSHAKTG